MYHVTFQYKYIYSTTKSHNKQATKIHKHLFPSTLIPTFTMLLFFILFLGYVPLFTLYFLIRCSHVSCTHSPHVTFQCSGFPLIIIRIRIHLTTWSFLILVIISNSSTNICASSVMHLMFSILITKCFLCTQYCALI